MIAFAAERRLPTLVVQRHWVEAGGLTSDLPDRLDMYRRVAAHVDKILKGTNPGDIPVELPTKIRARHQPEDRGSARYHDPAGDPRPCGCRDRVRQTNGRSGLYLLI
jgi:hypothetical protein